MVNEHEIKSTLSSEDEKSFEAAVHEHEEKYENLQGMLSVNSIGAKPHGKQRILVESVFHGLLGETKSLFQIPCLMSADNSTFFVYLNEMDSRKFNKTALFNLVDTAEQSSADVKKMIFILSKNDATKFAEMEKLFSIIDSVRMNAQKIEEVCENQQLLSIQRDFGFFELEL